MTEQTRDVEILASPWYVNGLQHIEQQAVEMSTSPPVTDDPPHEKFEADKAGSERTIQTPSEMDDEDGNEMDELFRYLYFDGPGDAQDVDSGSSKRHEIQTVPLFTSSALGYINTIRNNGNHSIRSEEC